MGACRPRFTRVAAGRGCALAVTIPVQHETREFPDARPLQGADEQGRHGAAFAVSWSARQYVRFEDERTRPVRDLLAALPRVEAHTAIDIGCGPGNSTELLAARFPGAAVSGIDGSPDMIAAAQARLPGLRFDLEDITRWADAAGGPAGDGPASFDVILANAVLQWVPDHARLFPALKARLAPGGCLAVQMPDGAWAGKLANCSAARSPIDAADRYHELLRGADCKVDVWRTTYHHSLAGGAAGVVEWFKGSGLRPFIEPLDDHERNEFLARYLAAVAQAYPAMADGSVLLPFPRLFIVALA
jgi:trans-aconitate 2-methyltransferase